MQTLGIRTAEQPLRFLLPGATGLLHLANGQPAALRGHRTHSAHVLDSAGSPCLDYMKGCWGQIDGSARVAFVHLHHALVLAIQHCSGLFVTADKPLRKTCHTIIEGRSQGPECPNLLPMSSPLALANRPEPVSCRGLQGSISSSATMHSIEANAHNGQGAANSNRLRSESARKEPPPRQIVSRRRVDDGVILQHRCDCERAKHRFR